MSSYPQPKQNYSILFSLLLIAFGLLAGPAPMLASVAVVAALAWLIVFDGLAQLVFPFKRKAMAWEFLAVAVYLGAGVWFLFQRLSPPAGLTLVLALFLFAEAAADVAGYFWVRKNRSSICLLFDGVITAVLALVVWMPWPSSSVWALSTLVGVKILMAAMSRLVVAIAERKRPTAEAPLLERAA